MRKNNVLFLLLISACSFMQTQACSIVYYIDSITGKIYAANNEDYWYDVNAYIRILPSDDHALARLWYGWDHFAQGGINEAGLFFDGAATPETVPPPGYAKPRGNLGDRILAYCKTVDEALKFLDQEKVGLTNGHLLFGDRTGKAAVVEWTGGKKTVTFISNGWLMATNFLLADTALGNYPCPRYRAMETEIHRLKNTKDSVTLKEVGNIIARAVQPERTDAQGRKGGTLYSSFINITDMQFVLVYKLDASNIIRLDLKKEFASGKKRKIKLR